MTAKSTCSGRHPDGRDHVVLADGIHHVQAVGHLAEDRMLAIEVRLGGMTDEELAAAGIPARMRHGQRTRHMPVGVAIGLALDGVAGSPGAHARIIGIARERVTTLDHEVVYDPMEAGAMIEA